LILSHPNDEFLSEPEALTNGFCFINNVAVAAAYLKHMFRDKIK
jgi:acetoin utilization deacetylase AcuC-like enzyme